MTTSSIVESALTEERLRELRVQAKHEARRFIDPALLRETRRTVPTVPAPWLRRVVGEPFDPAELPWWGRIAALLASREDHDHLASLEAARRDAVRQAAEAEAAAARARG